MRRCFSTGHIQYIEHAFGGIAEEIAQWFQAVQRMLDGSQFCPDLLWAQEVFQAGPRGEALQAHPLTFMPMEHDQSAPTFTYYESCCPRSCCSVFSRTFCPVTPMLSITPTAMPSPSRMIPKRICSVPMVECPR